MSRAENEGLLRLFAKDGMPFLPSARLLKRGSAEAINIHFFQDAITAAAILTFMRRRGMPRVSTVPTSWANVSGGQAQLVDNREWIENGTALASQVPSPEGSGTQHSPEIR